MDQNHIPGPGWHPVCLQIALNRGERDLPFGRESLSAIQSNPRDVSERHRQTLLCEPHGMPAPASSDVHRATGYGKKTPSLNHECRGIVTPRRLRPATVPLRCGTCARLTCLHISNGTARRRSDVCYDTGRQVDGHL